MASLGQWNGRGGPGSIGRFVCLALAFGALTYAFVTSDFSLRPVAANSHTDKPMLYKVTGVWGNHEGSMLLWSGILAPCAAMAAGFGDSLRPTLKARVLGVQGAISLAFLRLLILTSNPFERLSVPSLDGTDLNPLLQDPGFHGGVGRAVAAGIADAPETPAAGARCGTVSGSPPALEICARDLSKCLRFLVCRNENIDGSTTDLARDLRVAVRERPLAGDSDVEMIDYLVARYGEYVLLKPDAPGVRSR